jgi:hypothetical protein
LTITKTWLVVIGGAGVVAVSSTRLAPIAVAVLVGALAYQGIQLAKTSGLKVQS